jgi:hypothetical protein
METSVFGGTPARNPGDSGALQMGKKVRATVYCNRKSLGQKLGTEVVEIDEIELIPSSKTAAAARSKFGGLELDWLGFLREK